MGRQEYIEIMRLTTNALGKAARATEEELKQAEELMRAAFEAQERGRNIKAIEKASVPGDVHGA